MFHHGTPGTRLQALLATEAAVRQQVRLVAFNRPGYGASPDAPPSLASVGADTVSIADALSIEHFGVVGVSGGGPYALAAGVADPQRVRAVGLVAGIGPWRLVHPEDEDDLERALLSLADTGDVTAALHGFTAQAAAEFDGLLAADDAALVTAYFEGVSPDDLQWLDAQARDTWAADLREALTTFDGYARDNVAWGGAWDINPAELRCPAWLWYGDQDRLVPPAHGRWLADTIPTAQLVPRPGAGHGSTCFGYWDSAFATLRTPLLNINR